jgi:hypothetical protein
MTKAEEKTPTKATVIEPQTPSQPATDGGLPVVSMILGVVSLAMFMLFLGLPALILGIIGLKKYPTNRAFSITGIVTGAISTLIMIGFILLLVFGVLAAVLNADSSSSDSSTPSDHYHYDTRDFQDQDGRGGA